MCNVEIRNMVSTYDRHIGEGGGHYSVLRLRIRKNIYLDLTHNILLYTEMIDTL